MKRKTGSNEYEISPKISELFLEMEEMALM